MLLDALTNLTQNTPGFLTGVAAGATGYSDTLDISVPRDLSPDRVPYSVQFTTLPTSATAGATLNIALQGSVDNATWVTMEETAAQPIANITANTPWAMRGFLPATSTLYRYFRFAFTPSAALTAGVPVAQIAGEWPRDPYYPRNFVA